MAYVDVRGIWPMLVVEYRCYVLEGYPRNITVEDAVMVLGIQDEVLL